MSNKKQKIYFGCLPEDQIYGFFERLKMALALGKKTHDKKSFEFEIKGTRKDPKGCSIEFVSFGSDTFNNYFNTSQEHMKKSLFMFSLNFKVKEQKDIEIAKKGLETIKKILLEALKNSKYMIDLSNYGKRCFLDFYTNEEKFIEKALELGINLSEYHEFKSVLKSSINIYEFFENNNSKKILEKILSLFFSIKISSENVKYLVGAIINALIHVKINNRRIQKKYDETVNFLNFIYAYIGSKIKFEYNSKILMESFKEKEEQAFLKYKEMIKPLVLNAIKPLLENMGLLDFANSIYSDEIFVNFCFPKYKNGFSLVIKIPGISDFVSNNLYKNIFLLFYWINQNYQLF